VAVDLEEFGVVVGGGLHWDRVYRRGRTGTPFGKDFARRISVSGF
jgi:hypothetical protein